MSRETQLYILETPQYFVYCCYTPAVIIPPPPLSLTRSLARARTHTRQNSHSAMTHRQDE